MKPEETATEETFMRDGPGMSYDPNHTNPMAAAFDSIKNMKPEDTAKLWEYAQVLRPEKTEKPNVVTFQKSLISPGNPKQSAGEQKES